MKDEYALLQIAKLMKIAMNEPAGYYNTQKQQNFVLRKEAGMYDYLSSFLRQNYLSLKSKIQKIKSPGYIKNKIVENIPEITSAGIGALGGAYLGNMAYHNAIPPVRQLPGIEQMPHIMAENAYPYSSFDANGY